MAAKKKAILKKDALSQEETVNLLGSKEGGGSGADLAEGGQGEYGTSQPTSQGASTSKPSSPLGDDVFPLPESVPHSALLVTPRLSQSGTPHSSSSSGSASLQPTPTLAPPPRPRGIGPKLSRTKPAAQPVTFVGLDRSSGSPSPVELSPSGDAAKAPRLLSHFPDLRERQGVEDSSAGSHCSGPPGARSPPALDSRPHINLNTLMEPTFTTDNLFSSTMETPVDVPTGGQTAQNTNTAISPDTESKNNNEHGYLGNIINDLDKALRDTKIKFMDDSFD